MTKPKTLDQLRAEKERAETQLAQEQHKLNRLENRKKYLEKGERQKRTHRLCNLGGTIESLAPEVKDLNRAAQIAKAVGALGAFAFLQILLSILKTLQLVLFLCKLRLGLLLFGLELVEGFRFCHCN